MSGMPVYREIRGRRWLIDDWRRAQSDALRRLSARLDRPVLPRELAAELGAEPDDVTHIALVRNGYALLRKVPGSNRKGLWPRETVELRLLEAYQAFRTLAPGTRLEWTEPRRTPTRQYRTRQMTITKTLRSRVRTSLRQARIHLGLRSLKQVEEHHLRMIPEAVWLLQMERSNVPRREWESRGTEARRARKTASNRRAEIHQFLSWAEWKGYLCLHSLQDGTLPPAWAEFVRRAEGESDRQHDVAARRLAKLAVERLQADSPDRFVEVGFARLEDSILTDSHYASTSSARTTLAKLRQAWNLCARMDGHRPYPEWPIREPRGSKRRLADGGLTSSWWSAKGFFERRPTLLDAPGMEVQKRQARDLQDWWMLEDPGLRPDSEGGPLPKRPTHSRMGRGRKRFGARSPEEQTAVKPLSLVSKFQRFCLSYDHQAARISPSAMAAIAWEELFADSARVKRFVAWIFEQSHARNRSRGITAGVKIAWYTQTLMWAYFPAWCQAEIAEHRARSRVLDLDSADGLREAQAIERKIGQLEERIQHWQALARELRKYIEDLTVRHGGIQPVKSRTDIRESLSFGEIRRMADALKRDRLERAERLRQKTDRLIASVRRDRSRPCRDCGERGCDAHHPLPEVAAKSGIAWTVMDRTYCKLITSEAMLRLHSVLPWRPGTFRRALIGIHIDPVTLEIAVRGHDLKVERDARGEVRRQKVAIQDLEYWEDPDEVRDTVEALRMLIEEARVWLLRNPTKTARRGWKDSYDLRLFLHSRGAPWTSSSEYTASFTGVLQSAARLVNERLEPGQEPVRLPQSWGACGSYVTRFLYGDRIKRRGGSYEDIAEALGNSPLTARRHYQDEQEGEALSRITRTLRGQSAGKTDVQAEHGGGVTDIEALLARKLAEFGLADAARERILDEEVRAALKRR